MFPLVFGSGIRNMRRYELKAGGGCAWWLEDTEETEGRLLEGEWDDRGAVRWTQSRAAPSFPPI